MESKTCTICKIERHINNFYKQYSECRDCNRTRGLKRNYEKKDKTSNQQKIYYGKNRDRIFLQKQNNECIQFRGLVVSYVELEDRIKALEERVKKTKYVYTKKYSYICTYTHF